ncbi:MAG: NADH-quinone oxidoreductase subunit C [Bacteroidota bacterium]
MKVEEIAQLVRDQCGTESVIDIDLTSSPHSLIIRQEDIVKVCQELHENEQMYFDMLSCLTGIDNGPEAGTLELIYNLYSIPYDVSLMLKVFVPRNMEQDSLPSIDSVAHIWRTADWHERETFDLIGIQFEGHPDLRRILLPANWEGYPLRKDYKHQDYYHGIKVEY